MRQALPAFQRLPVGSRKGRRELTHVWQRGCTPHLPLLSLSFICSLGFSHTVSLQGLKHSSYIPASGPLHLLFLNLRGPFNKYPDGSHPHFTQPFYPKVYSVTHFLATLPKTASPTLKTSYFFFSPLFFFSEFILSYIFYLLYIFFISPIRM